MTRGLPELGANPWRRFGFGSCVSPSGLPNAAGPSCDESTPNAERGTHVFMQSPRHSAFMIMTGLTRVARRAGTRQAIVATTTKPRAVVRKVNGSVDSTPNSNL